MSTECRNITVYQRTDCLPQGRATEHACTTAGCCWGPLAIPNAPPCFYPQNYKGYFVQSHKRIPGGMSYTLLRNTTSGWPHDINTLHLDVTYEGSTRLHFKVSHSKYSNILYFGFSILTSISDCKFARSDDLD